MFPLPPSAALGMLLATTEPAAVPMSGVNLGEAMMGVNGTNDSCVGWPVRDWRSAVDDGELVVFSGIAGARVRVGEAASGFAGCAKGIVAFVMLCSMASSLFAVDRRSKSERDGLLGMLLAKGAGGLGIAAGEGAVRTSMYAALQANYRRTKCSFKDGRHATKADDSGWPTAGLREGRAWYSSCVS